jgi:BirA family transcriptional regulator, biotin operon repressor / biotin---[acetyl-CoA-carboxylase] ligase
VNGAPPGARLRPDWRLEIHEVLPSTSERCRALASAGAPEGLAVLARRQTQGRGSRGREWESPIGNLFLSVLLRPQERARDAAQWSLLAGVALGEALSVFLPDASALSLKWPNDVLLHGKKLAGILVDSSAGPDGALDWLVIGIGANLAVAPDVPGRAVACLADLVAPPAPEPFAEALLARLRHWCAVREAAGFAAVRAAWLARAPAAGSHVTLRLGETLLGGGFAGLGEDGSLLLASDGRIRAFAAGEVLT